MRTREQEEREAHDVRLDVNFAFKTNNWRRMGFDSIEAYINHFHIDYLTTAEEQLRALRRNEERKAR